MEEDLHTMTMCLWMRCDEEGKNQHTTNDVCYTLLVATTYSFFFTQVESM